MKDKIIDQLKEAFEIMKDDPRLKDVIDVQAARWFFAIVSNFNIALMPRFTEMDKSQVASYVRECTGLFNEWINGLRAIKGVVVLPSSTSMNGEHVLWGKVYGNISFAFSTGNRAEFGEQKGTWPEIYEAIVLYTKEHVYIPPFPASVTSN